MPHEKSALLADICALLAADQFDDARRRLNQRYPFDPIAKAAASGPRFSKTDSMRLFLRDGFIDRYSGVRLFNPGALHVIATLLPHDFPYHSNWKMSESHIGWWEFFPTIDHIVPLSRGGAHDDDNLVTTCMLRNGTKSNWLLDELGWTLHPRGDLTEWDGLSQWLLNITSRRPELSKSKRVMEWARATSGA